MLTFYYHPLSPLARRVWIALLEKNLDFEAKLVNLRDKEQFKPEYLAINPFHHVPVIIDGDFRVIESLAILDYLESKYPTPRLLPEDSQQLAKVRMAQMVTLNELSPKIVSLIIEEKSLELNLVKRQIPRVLQFLGELLAEDKFFGGDELSLGDIVAGNAVILIGKLGYEFPDLSTINTWCDRLMQREAWQTTQPNAEQIEIFKQTAKAIITDRK
jgi:glutathione S-transferase